MTYYWDHDHRQTVVDRPISFGQLMSHCLSGRRICPKPGEWNKVWKMLRDKERVGSGWRPGLPLILAAWAVAGDELKRVIFIEHILWARDHGAWDEVAA